MVERNRILVGIVGAPHGVRGEVRLKSYTGVPADIARYAPLICQDGGRALTIRTARPIKDDMLVVAFEGVGNRDAAAALTNQRLYVDRTALPDVEEEEFYHADLIGLRAEAADGVALGHVVAVVDYGAGDLLEIQPEQGETLLVAFTRAFVPTVDLAGGRVVLSAEATAVDEDDDEPEEPAA